MVKVVIEFFACFANPDQGAAFLLRISDLRQKRERE
jgi:hypothetical protein